MTAPARVAVLTGGRSSERAVSLRARDSLLDGLAQSGHEGIAIDVDSDGVWRRDGRIVELCPGRGIGGVDVVFPSLIGAYGEDGTVQGLLECLGVAYVGADVLSSALCFDKAMFKRVIAQAGLPQARYRTVDVEEFARRPADELTALSDLGLPLFVKPTRSGSSIGVSRVERAGDLPAALRHAFAYGPVSIVEEAVGGCEVECSVIGDRDLRISSPGEVVAFASRSGWRDQASKSSGAGVDLRVPARVSDRALTRVSELAVEVFRLVGCSGLARVDFFVDGDQVLVNEVNTMPGIHRTSVFALMLEWSGVPYAQMLDHIVGAALERHRRRSAART